ncbi:hypothetical protein D3C75_916230 [compost metagenome]
MGFAVFGEDLFKHWVKFATVYFARTFNHFDATKRNNCTFQWSISLQANDSFEGLVDVTSIMGGDGGSEVSIEVNRRVSAVFLFNAFHDVVPQCGSCFSSTCQEGLVTLVRGVVFLNKVTHVDFILPVAFGKTFPGCG